MGSKLFYRFKRYSYLADSFSENSETSKLIVPILAGGAIHHGRSLANVALNTPDTSIYVRVNSECANVTVNTPPENITRHSGRNHESDYTKGENKAIREAKLFDFRVNIGGIYTYVLALGIDAKKEGDNIICKGEVSLAAPSQDELKEVFEFEVWDSIHQRWRPFFNNTKLVSFEWVELDDYINENSYLCRFNAVLKKRK
jgi:hypothetical protein